MLTTAEMHAYFELPILLAHNVGLCCARRKQVTDGLTLDTLFH